MASSTTTVIPVELILGLTLALLLFIAAALQQLWRPSSKKNKHQHEKDLPLPPGRFGLPLIGETLEFLGTRRKGVPWKFFDDRISAYGETFKTSLMASPTIVLASPSVNTAAFSILVDVQIKRGYGMMRGNIIRLKDVGSGKQISMDLPYSCHLCLYYKISTGL